MGFIYHGLRAAVLGLMLDQMRNELIYSISLFAESTPLRCYRNNSFFMFLRQSFLNFTFPKLTNFLSLIPPQREYEVQYIELVSATLQPLESVFWPRVTVYPMLSVFPAAQHHASLRARHLPQEARGGGQQD